MVRDEQIPDSILNGIDEHGQTVRKLADGMTLCNHCDAPWINVLRRRLLSETDPAKRLVLKTRINEIFGPA